MSVTFNGSTGLLEWNKGAGSLPVTSFPFSIALRFRSPVSGSNQFIAGIQQSNADTWLEAWEDGNGTTVYSSARVAGNGTAASASSANFNTMRLMIVCFTATSTNVAYNGPFTSPGSAPVSNPLGTCDRIVIGGRHNNNNAADLFLNGDVAEVHFFNRQLLDADVTTLNADYKPEQLSGWVDGWSLKDTSDLTSLGGTRTLSLVGGVTSTGSHPITRTAAGPSITVQPSNQTVTAPATATFTITASATGGGTLSYQWKNGATNVGTNSNSLTTGATTVTGGSWNNGASITCVVTETGGTNAGSVTSSAATLTVNASSGRLFRQAPGSQLTGIGASGPFFTNPLN